VPVTRGNLPEGAYNAWFDALLHADLSRVGLKLGIALGRMILSIGKTEHRFGRDLVREFAGLDGRDYRRGLDELVRGGLVEYEPGKRGRPARGNEHAYRGRFALVLYPQTNAGNSRHLPASENAATNAGDSRPSREKNLGNDSVRSHSRSLEEDRGSASDAAAPLAHSTTNGDDMEIPETLDEALGELAAHLSADVHARAAALWQTPGGRHLVTRAARNANESGIVDEAKPREFVEWLDDPFGQSRAAAEEGAF